MMGLLVRCPLLGLCLMLVTCQAPQSQFKIRLDANAVRIQEISSYTIPGERYAVVAPNAYIGTRAKQVSHSIAVINTNVKELVGYGLVDPKGAPKVCRDLIGLDPVDLFTIEKDCIVGVNEKYKDLVYKLNGLDMAILDIVGKVLKKPVAKLWGDLRRESVNAYDSTLYFEDLLEEKDLKEYPFVAENPMERLANKAKWVVEKRGIQILKVKVGRPGRMKGDHKGVLADIEAVKTIRKAVGPTVGIFVDGNNGYKGHPEWVMEFAKGVKDCGVFAMEEMIPEDLDHYRKLKEELKSEGIKMEIADGESVWGFSEEWGEKFLKSGAVDIAQPDFGIHGFLNIRRWAKMAEGYGAKLICHNFGTLMGSIGSAHIALSIENSDMIEVDDAEFPGIELTGLRFEKGKYALTGESGLGIRISDETLRKSRKNWVCK